MNNAYHLRTCCTYEIVETRDAENSFVSFPLLLLFQLFLFFQLYGVISFEPPAVLPLRARRPRRPPSSSTFRPRRSLRHRRRFRSSSALSFNSTPSSPLRPNPTLRTWCLPLLFYLPVFCVVSERLQGRGRGGGSLCMTLQ